MSFINRALSGASKNSDEVTLSPPPPPSKPTPPSAKDTDVHGQDKQKLEALLNHHLSQLGYLYKRIKSLNEEIEQDKLTLASMTEDHQHHDWKIAAAWMQERINAELDHLMSRGRIVGFHRAEIVRIERAMKKIREQDGGVWHTPEW